MSENIDYINNKNNKVRKPKCHNGPNCKFKNVGRCDFYHPKEYFHGPKFLEAPPASDLPIPHWSVN